MKKFGKILLIGLSFGLVTLTIGFLTNPPTPVQGAPGPAPVTVVNTPLPVQGTVNANVTNASIPVTGTVSVSSVGSLPPVSGTVAVSTMPAVTLSGTPNVNVVNTEFGPVPVEPSAAAARLRAPQRCLFSGPMSPFQDGQNSCSEGSVSQGYNLAVETVSLSVTVPSGTVIENAYYGVFQAPPASTIPSGFVVLTKVASDTSRGLDFYVGTADVRAYFFSGESVGCVITTSFPTTGLFTGECDVSGHLVLM
jgi:hypothetical protein